MYALNEKIIDFSVNGVRILGNPSNGAIIGIDNVAGDDLDQILTKTATVEQIERQAELLQELQKNSYFSQSENSLDSAYVHLTSACNLHCLGCYSFESERNKKDMLSTEQECFILKNLRQSGVHTLILSGGEPFLRKDIVEILRYAKETLGFPNVIIASNGTLPIENYMKCTPFIDLLSFSIDGYAENVVYLRDPGIMPKIKENLEVLKGLVNLSMIVTLHRKNLNDISEYIKLSNRLQIPFSISLFTASVNDPIFKDFVLTDENYATLETMYECFDNVELSDSALEGSLGCRNACGAGKTMVSISSTGDIYPCHMLQMDEFKIGNALTDNIAEAVSRGALYTATVDSISDCDGCEYKYLCGGGCRYRSYAYFNGDMNRADKCCGTYKRSFAKRFDQLLNN